MKNILCFLAPLLLVSCTKPLDNLIEKAISPKNSSSGYTSYLIKKGGHYSNLSSYKNVEISELKFTVLFDSSAIYLTTQEENQYDVNKLYGFSDNNAQHHEYSARFGWSWTNNALHLYAYVYNQGQRSINDLGSVDIGEEKTCSIKVTSNKYLFSLGDKTVEMERSSKTSLASGYMLYPYFGGDELAPQDINIRIKNL